MMRLKATILDEQQKLSFRQSTKTNRLRGSRGAKSGDRKDIFQERNAGLEERKTRDLADRTNTSSQDKITSTLAAKVCTYIGCMYNAICCSYDVCASQAQIYEELKNGKLSIGKSSSDMLINFDSKAQSSKSSSYIESSSHCERQDEDEMGRMKRQRPNEDVHSYYGPASASVVSSECTHRSEKKDNWEWSRGVASKEDGREERDFAEDREYAKYIEERVKSAATSTTSANSASTGKPDQSAGHYGPGSHTSNSYYGPSSGSGIGIGGDAVHMSESSRVKSQWEKTLQGESRHHLERIHRETEAMRHIKEQQRQQQQAQGHNSASASASVEGGSVGKGSGLGSGTSQVLEERRELLRRKQLERKMQRESGSGSSDVSGSGSEQRVGI
jgi:hypothetical protein